MGPGQLYEVVVGARYSGVWSLTSLIGGLPPIVLVHEL